MNTIVSVFGSNRLEQGSPAYEEARELGRLLALKGYAVCNGGYGGVMEASARGAREAGGHTIGITLRAVPSPANPYIREEIKADSLFERLRRLLEKARGFVILPGGTGTLVELALCLELQLKRLTPPKPVILLGSYWKSVLDALEPEVKFMNPFRIIAPRSFPETVLFAAPTAAEAVSMLERFLPQEFVVNHL
jgi:uncharacterized protein (TIGR00730 family)